jgi:hypothetical protein
LAALSGAPIQHVEFAWRRASETIDHQRDTIAGLERQVAADSIEHLIDDGIGGFQCVTATARLPVNTDTDFHLTIADLKNR